MASNRRIGGIIFVKADGQQFRAKGSWSYNLGKPKREMIAGSDSIHGFKEMPQVPFVEGVITDSDDLNVESVLLIRDATITLELANGKVIVLREACFAGDGNISTEEGEIEARFEGIEAEEV